MRIELTRGPADPASTEEEDDGGAGLIFRVAFGIKDMELEFGVANSFVGNLFVRGEISEFLSRKVRDEREETQGECKRFDHVIRLR